VRNIRRNSWKPKKCPNIENGVKKKCVKNNQTKKWHKMKGKTELLSQLFFPGLFRGDGG
jgi:hypothetical protein